MHQFLQFIFGIKLYMFRTVPLSTVRNFSLYTQQWYMACRFAESLQVVSIPVWHIPMLCVQWKTPDGGQRNCPKHVEFYSKNKFEKLVHLVGFIIRIDVVQICALVGLILRRQSMGPASCLETLVKKNSYSTLRKIPNGYPAVEAWNHAWWFTADCWYVLMRF